MRGCTLLQVALALLVLPVAAHCGGGAETGDAGGGPQDGGSNAGADVGHPQDASGDIGSPDSGKPDAGDGGDTTADDGGNPDTGVVDAGNDAGGAYDGGGDVGLVSGNVGHVWANTGEDKVTQDDIRVTNGLNVKNSIWDGSTVRLFGAQNEVVSFALILEAPDAEATAVSVVFDRLEGPGGDVIGTAEKSPSKIFSWVDRKIEIFYVRYLQIKGLSLLSYEHYDERHIPKRLQRPWTGDGEGQGNWTDRPDHDKFYPDIAVPMELVPSFAIEKGRSQTVWVDVYVPKTALAGVYRGTVTVAEDGVPSSTVPVELTVHGFALPDVPSSKTMLDLGYEDINKRYLGIEYPSDGTPEDQASREIRRKHIQIAHRHRLSIIGDFVDAAGNQPHPDWQEVLDGTLFTAQNGYDGPGTGTGNGVYSIGTYGSWGWDGEGEQGMRTHANAWVQWFDAHAPAAEYFVYLIDESDNYPQIEQWSQWLKNNPGVGKKLKSFATISLPEAAANTPSLQIAASTLGVGITGAWDGAKAAWQGTPGKRFFCYNGSRPASGSFATDDDGVALRELAWGAYKKGIDRWFYWESTYYNDFQGGRGQTDVFADAQTFGGPPSFDNELGETSWNHTNGDGVLFYPGTDTVYPANSYGVMGPFASLRMKHWRRGLQDVDYLALAAAKDAAKVQQIVDRMVPKALWEYGVSDPGDPTWVRTDISWSIAPDEWEKARADLAAIIESR